jgi:uncharacterized membrane protein YsdA (DUF1294 family)/cold shock CspA family protein
MESCSTGTVVEWNDARGFGFIRPNQRDINVFFHISSFHGRGRPTEGLTVTFDVQDPQSRRPRALNVQIPKKLLPTIPQGFVVSLAVVTLFFATLGIYSHFYSVPRWLLIDYGVMSVIAYLAYWVDKGLARAGDRRIPEKTLHWIELLGGWPGALLAQWYLRHKNRKGEYQFVYWFFVIVNIGILWRFFLPEWSRPMIDMLPGVLKQFLGA